MAKCSVCEKATVFGHNRSHALNATNRTWKPNIKKVKIQEESGNVKRVYVCTSCLRSGKVKRASV